MGYQALLVSLLLLATVHAANAQFGNATPQPRDCMEVCIGSTDPEFIGDTCCARHYCACQMGFGADRYCQEGEGFCNNDGRCSEGGCSLETCCEDTFTSSTGLDVM